MRKIIAIIFVSTFVLASVVAVADVDISGLSYDELIDLVNKAQMEMMKMDKWQEVVVPEGIYIIGKDIPAGRWTITAPEKLYTVLIYVGKKLYDDFTVDFDSMTSLKGTANSMYREGDTSSITLELKDDMYLQIKSGSAIFSPYQGNSFSFR